MERIGIIRDDALEMVDILGKIGIDLSRIGMIWGYVGIYWNGLEWIGNSWDELEWFWMKLDELAWWILKVWDQSI